LKVCFELLQEEGDSGTKFYWDGGLVWLPVGSDEKFFGVPVIQGTCKYHLSIDVAAEAVGNFGEVLGPSCVGGLWAKVKT
jgi:hypothetical protein